MTAQTQETIDGDRSIRVLIVDDRPETQESIRKLLRFQSSIEVVGTASSGEEALQQTSLLKPDVVLMDLKMPGMDGVEATKAITKQFPFAQVIMMSVQTDAESARHCMLAGARDFLSKPFTANDLIDSIHSVFDLDSGRRAVLEQAAAVEQRMESPSVRAAPQGKIVTVFSPKGGTGSSTVAVNLAVALQNLGDHKVALVDANLQFGDVAALLNLSPTRSMSDLVPQIQELDTELIDAVLMSHRSGLKALLAPSRSELAEFVAPQHARAILEQMQEMFDYIVVDTKGVLHDLEIGILDLSSRILLVTTPDLPAVKNAKLFLAVTETLEYPDERVCLIVNKADRADALDISEIEQSLQCAVVMRLPEDRPSVMQAANTGIPFVLAEPKSPLSQVTTELATWLTHELEETHAGLLYAEEPNPRRRLPFARIFQRGAARKGGK